MLKFNFNMSTTLYIKSESRHTPPSDTIQKKEKPIFIRLLEYGEKVGLSGTNHTEADEWAYNNGIISKRTSEETTTENALLRELFTECFRRHGSVGGEGYVLSAEYYFRLIEFRELEEARKASNSANRNAMWAIGISVVAILISCIMAYKPIKID